MMTWTKVAVRLLAAFLVVSSAVSVSRPAQAEPAAAGHSETAVLAGGCFWGMQAVFERLRGVAGVDAGFSGGSALTAHYETVSTGLTGHAESVRVRFDPTQISYATLLKVYFKVAHDPTELNRQGPDEGSQYRSEIFYTTPDQQRIAQTTIAELTAAHAFKTPIVTKVESFSSFYPAESYHQHFYDRNPNYPYIVENDKVKVDQLRTQFASLVRDEKEVASQH